MRGRWLVGGLVIGCAASPTAPGSVSRAQNVRIPTARTGPSPCGRVGVPPPARTVVKATRTIDLGNGYRARLPVDFVAAGHDDVEWLAGAPEPGSIRRGAWTREPGDDDLFVSALTVADVGHEVAGQEQLDAQILDVFAAIEPGYLAGTGLGRAEAFSLLAYSAGWLDDRQRLHLEYGRVWKGCERVEQYSHAVAVDSRIIHVSLFVNGSAPTHLLDTWLSSFFDEPFAGVPPSARANLAGQSSRD